MVPRAGRKPDLYLLFGVPPPDPDRLRPGLSEERRAKAERVGRLGFKSANARRTKRWRPEEEEENP
jgi:hypothetical protein